MGPIHSKSSKPTTHITKSSKLSGNKTPNELIPPSLPTKKSTSAIQIETPSMGSRHSRKIHAKTSNNKRITMIISTHGNELIKTRLIRPSWDNKIRVFSLSGKLSVCSEYTDEKIREYDRFLKANFAKQLKLKNSTHNAIITLQTNFWKDYLSELVEALDTREKMLEHLYQKKLSIDRELSIANKRIIYSKEDEEWYDHPDIEKVDKEIRVLDQEIAYSKESIHATKQNKHMKTYVPVIDKVYFFPEEEDGEKTTFFIKVIHYDGERNKIVQKLDFTKIDSVLQLFKQKKLRISEELLNIYKRDYVRKMIRLSTMINILRQADFDIINLIDTSYRVFNADAFTNETKRINEIEKEEEGISIQKQLGGRLFTSRKTMKCR